MARGGTRAGAGRKSVYGETTERIRVPVSMLEGVRQFVATKGLTLPVFSSRVQAGYPMPADDHIDDQIDIVSLLGGNLEGAFIVYANGDSMKDAGIYDGDPLLVKPGAKVQNGKIVVASIDGQVTVKFLIVKKGKQYLMPANPAYDEIPIDPEHGVVIHGIVDTSFRLHRH